MGTHKVRTTMQPDVEIEVGDAELLDLQRSGLLTKDPKKDPEELPEARGSRPPATTSGSEKK
jgi:hypothetical protein